MNAAASKSYRSHHCLALLLPALATLACAPADPGGAGTGPGEKAAEAVVAPLQAVPPATPAGPASLGEMPEAVARLESLAEEVEKAVAESDAERKAGEQLEAALRRVDRIRHRSEPLPLDELLDISRRLAATTRSVADSAKTIGTRLERLEADLRRVAELKATFEAFGALATEPGAPPALRLRVGICNARLADLSESLAAKRTEVLVLVDRLSEARGNVAATKTATELRIADAERRLADWAAEPLWALGPGTSEEWERAGARHSRNLRRVRSWLTANGTTILAVLLVVLGGTVALLRRLRSGAEGRAATDPDSAALLRLMESPWAAGLPLAILAILLLTPAAPPAVYDVAWLPAAPAAAWVVVRVLGPSVRRIAWVLAASLALTPVTAALREVPLAGRLLTILATLPLAVVLAVDLNRSRRVGLLGSGPIAAPLRAIAWGLSACLAAASAAAVVGQTGFSALLGRGALETLGGVVLVVAAYLVLAGLLRSLFASRPAQRLRMVREHAGLVTSTLLKTLKVLGGLGLVVVAIQAFGAGSHAGAALGKALETKTVLGVISISPAAIVLAALLAWLTTLAARLLGFLLAEEVLPRLDLRRGTAVAISGTTRYLVLLAGWVLAAAVAGVDLTKFGFLAGALGVGVGFGLQNVVSNFVSGLILLFERPVQVGDAVDVSGGGGTVTRIGIRASTVRTFEGADVIVPNADLISKSVTNWTGSNPDRRFDVSVGVAYGTPMETTARVLLEAARSTRGVLAEPAPGAFFESFGESSLDWTLRVWVRMDESPKVLSDLRRAVSEGLAKEGIEVPFPQRDVHVRSMAPGSK